MVSSVGTPEEESGCSIDELQTWTSEEFATIPVQHLQNEVGDFEERLQTVIDIGGLQVEVLQK